MVNGEYDCHSNQLTSFEGLPGVLGGGVNCSLNPLTSLKGLDFNSKIEGLITITYSENLPLLRLCVSNYQVDTCNEEVNSIINHCIKSYPNLKERIIECQYELIRAGFKNNAKW
jgi:hydroxylamine reductase (hybrid-cluster protein)